MPIDINQGPTRINEGVGMRGSAGGHPNPPKQPTVISPGGPMNVPNAPTNIGGGPTQIQK